MSTTTSPAPVTPPPRLGATPHAEEAATSHPESRWSFGLRWAGDVTSVVLLIAVLWWLAYHDGGFERVALAKVGLLAVVAVPAATVELRRMSTGARVLIAMWAVGLVASLLFAAERTSFAQPTITYALVPVVGLSTYRIWRRRWGPPALGGILLVSFGLYWREAFLGWWGFSLWEGREPVWRVLSWHNQSGILMATFALLFGGLALVGRRVIAVAFGVASAAALAGMWLSGSRGSLIVTIIGAILLVLAAGRARGWPSALARTVVLAIGTLALVGGLLLFAQSQGGSENVADRDFAVSGETADTSLWRRFLHADAAIGMFFDAPLTGQGVGSYRNMARPFTSPSSTLTSSAHNEYAEVLGEGGLALFLPFAGLTVLGALLAIRQFRGTASPSVELVGNVDSDDLRGPLAVGAIGAIGTLLIHQGADFDWGYPVIPALLAIAMATSAGAEADDRGARTVSFVGGAWTIVCGVGLLLLLAVSSTAALWEARSHAQQSELTAEELARIPVAWDASRSSDAAFQLARSGEYDLARWTLDRSLAWNPGYHPLRVDRSIVDYRAGDITGGELVASLHGGFADFASRNEVGAALIDGSQLELARAVLQETLGAYENYESWGIDAARAYTWSLVVQAEASEDGCAGAERAADRARTVGDMSGTETLQAIQRIVSEVCQ